MHPSSGSPRQPGALASMYRRLHARTTSQALLDLADAGDEAKARERITFLKKAVQGGHTKANDRPYAVTGVVPTGVAARSNCVVPAAAESAPYGPLRPHMAPHGHLTLTLNQASTWRSSRRSSRR